MRPAALTPTVPPRRTRGNERRLPPSVSPLSHEQHTAANDNAQQRESCCHPRGVSHTAPAALVVPGHHGFGARRGRTRGHAFRLRGGKRDRIILGSYADSRPTWRLAYIDTPMR